MDTVSNWDRKELIRELIMGRELAEQLRLHLNLVSSYETQELLLRILSALEKALLIPSKAGSASWQPQPVGSAAVPKKRVLPTGTNQPKDDGYSWRKYAMEIGDKYPRHYYICRYRHDQYCKATKQIQRPDDDDDDPTVLNITYIGSHTCGQVSHSVPPWTSPEKPEPKENNNQQQQQQQNNETLFNFRANRRINTEELNYKTFLMFVVVLFALYMCLLACVVLMCCV